MIETLLREGRAYHDTQTERLTGELEAAGQAAVPAALWSEFLNLSNHTIGEHLADWPRARALAELVLDGGSPDADTATAWAKLAAARFLAGDPTSAILAETACIKAASDPVAAYVDCKVTLAHSMLGGGSIAQAAAIFDAALDLARTDTPSPVDRQFAVASNNITAELLETADRTPAMDAAMRRGADAALAFWRRAGTRVNEERAQYLVAAVANALGEPARALDAANAGLALVAAGGDDPLDEIYLRLVRTDARARLADAVAYHRDLAEMDALAASLAADPARPRFKAFYAAARTKIRHL